MFTLVHVVISVLGIVAGLVAVGGMMANTHFATWAAIYLVTTILTSVTGFFFPFTAVTPAHVVGGISLVVLAVCAVALYGQRLQGSARRTYAITAVTALYLNSFVLVAQLFAKVPAMRELAPTQAEPPFGVTQALVLAVFVWLGRAAVVGFRGGR